MVDREHRIAANVANMTNQISPGLTIMPQLSGYPNYPNADVPLVQVVLSPIQELDSGSVNNTLHAGQPGTAALAHSILSPGLGPVLNTPVSLPMTVSQFASLGLQPMTNSPLLARSMVNGSPTLMHATFHPASKPPSPRVEKVTLTEVQPFDDELEQVSSGASQSSDHSNASKETKTTEELHDHANSEGELSKKSLESDGARPNADTVSLVSNPAPISMTSTGSDDGYRSRKISATSQHNVGSPKRGEVYV